MDPRRIDMFIKYVNMDPEQVDMDARHVDMGTLW